MRLRLGKLAIAFGIVLITASLSLGGSVPAKAAKASVNHSASSSGSQKKGHKPSHYAGKKSRKPRGQQAIDGGRTREIQEALVREHYLTGTPSGNWDAATQGALRRYQADQGWQSKTVPDSRALIRLGLGPDHQHLLNPETAMTMSMAPQFKRTSQTMSATGASPHQDRAAVVRAVSPSSPAALSPVPAQNSNTAAPASSLPVISPNR